MMRAVKWLRGLLFQNIGWKLLSLAAAVVIWALVASEPELATFATVRLEFKNLADDLEISSEPVGSVVLELRGPSGDMRGVGDAVRPAVVLDMSGVGPGQRTFTIGDGSVKLARGVHLVRSIPAQVRYQFEERSVRAVPIQVRWSGEGQNGYRVAGFTVDPPEIEIVGPSSRVARVAAAVTDPIDLSAQIGPADFRVNVFVDDPYVRIQSSAQAVVTVTMKKDEPRQ